MSSLQTKRATCIYLTKTPFQLHDILRYSGSVILFLRDQVRSVLSCEQQTYCKFTQANLLSKEKG